MLSLGKKEKANGICFCCPMASKVPKESADWGEGEQTDGGGKVRGEGAERRGREGEGGERKGEGEKKQGRGKRERR